MEKPIVQYTGLATFVGIEELYAIVRPLNHPSPHVSNTTEVLTSKIVAMGDNYFETENTIYHRSFNPKDGSNPEPDYYYISSYGGTDD